MPHTWKSPTPTPCPTHTPRPTPTPHPTMTPLPSSTPVPTPPHVPIPLTGAHDPAMLLFVVALALLIVGILSVALALRRPEDV